MAKLFEVVGRDGIRALFDADKIECVKDGGAYDGILVFVSGKGLTLSFSYELFNEAWKQALHQHDYVAHAELYPRHEA